MSVELKAKDNLIKNLMATKEEDQKLEMTFKGELGIK